MTSEQQQNKIKELEERIAKIEQYIEQRKTNQLSFPLDQVSREIIANP